MPGARTEAIPCSLVITQALLVAGVVLIALPAWALGIRGLFRRSGFSAAEAGDRASYAVVVGLRLLTLLLVLAFSAVTLVACVGAMIKDLDLPNLVYVFFVLDLLLAVLILLTFGRRDRRPVRRRANPAGR
jgi:hypothetical protein